MLMVTFKIFLLNQKNLQHYNTYVHMYIHMAGSEWDELQDMEQ